MVISARLPPWNSVYWFFWIPTSTMELNVPVTIKTTESGENERLYYAVSAMQGYRENMEDAHTVVLNLDAANTTSFFGVYDGHGGPAVSKYCAKHLHKELRKDGEFRQNNNNLTAAIQRTFLRMDEMMRDRRAGRELSEYGGNEYWNDYKKALRARRFLLPFCGQELPYEGPQLDGCTACVVLTRGNQIIVGNAGDSRCVLSRNGQAIDLSTDHKPYLPAERERIENAGKAIITNPEKGNIPRIDDGLAISRSLGDLMYKGNPDLPAQQQAVTAFPEVRTEGRTHDDQFLIIACDGIWDCMTSQQAVDFVRIYLTANVGLAFICEAILSHCLARPRGRDNMTVMLVRFKTPGALPPPPPSSPPPHLSGQPAGGHGGQESEGSASGSAADAPPPP